MNDPVSQFKVWYFKQPAFTRTFLSAVFILSVLYSFKIITVDYLYYDFTETFLRLQIWRSITALLFLGKFSFNLIISMYFTYFSLSRVETTLFTRRQYADFLWLVIYSWLMLIIAATFFGLYFFGDSFSFIMLYIWCKRRPTQTVTFFFGLQVQSGYFPFVYLGFNVLMGQSFIGYLVGLIIGHLYIFLKDIIKTKSHKDYLATPRFFENLVRKYILKETVRRDQQPQQPQQQPGFGVFGGRGVVIG